MDRPGVFDFGYRSLFYAAWLVLVVRAVTASWSVPQAPFVQIGSAGIAAVLTASVFFTPRRYRRYVVFAFVWLGSLFLIYEIRNRLPVYFETNIYLAVFYFASILLVLIGLVFTILTFRFPNILFLAPLILVYEVSFYSRFRGESRIFLLAVVGMTVMLAVLVLIVKRFGEQKQIIEESFNREKELNKMLAIANAEVMERERHRSVSLITAALAHELNNPINYMSGNMHFLKENFSVLEQRIHDEVSPAGGTDESTKSILTDSKKILTGFDQGFDRIVTVLRDLRELFERSSMSRSRSDLSKVISTILSVPGLVGKSTVTEVSLQPGLIVPGGMGELYSVFGNILRNAWEAAGEEGSVVVEAFEDDEWVVIKVSDNGAGVPEESRESIFDPFYSTKGKGMGVGLALCRTIVEKLGGSIWCEDNNGTPGACFVVMLPSAKNGTEENQEELRHGL